MLCYSIIVIHSYLLHKWNLAQPFTNVRDAITVGLLRIFSFAFLRTQNLCFKLFMLLSIFITLSLKIVCPVIVSLQKFLGWRQYERRLKKFVRLSILFFGQTISDGTDIPPDQQALLTIPLLFHKFFWMKKKQESRRKWAGPSLKTKKAQGQFFDLPPKASRHIQRTLNKGKRNATRKK